MARAVANMTRVTQRPSASPTRARGLGARLLQVILLASGVAWLLPDAVGARGDRHYERGGDGEGHGVPSDAGQTHAGHHALGIGLRFDFELGAVLNGADSFENVLGCVGVVDTH